jgi:hypothetical protein
VAASGGGAATGVVWLSGLASNRITIRRAGSVQVSRPNGCSRKKKNKQRLLLSFFGWLRARFGFALLRRLAWLRRPACSHPCLLERRLAGSACKQASRGEDSHPACMYLMAYVRFFSLKSLLRVEDSLRYGYISG